MALLLSGAFRSSDAAAATAGAAVRHAPRHARGHAPHARLGAAGGALLLFTVACCCCCAPAAAAAAGIAAASASSSSSSSATSGGSSAATNATGVLAFAGPPPATPLDRIFTALNPFRLFGLGDGSSAAEEAPSPFDGPNFLRLDGGNPDAPVAAPGTANLRNFVKVQARYGRRRAVLVTAGCTLSSLAAGFFACAPPRFFIVRCRSSSVGL